MSAFIGTLLVIGWEYVSTYHIFPARLITLYVLVGSFVFLLFERELLRLIRTLRYRAGRGVSRVMIIGNSDAAYDIASTLSNTHRSGYKIVAVVGPKEVVPLGLKAKHIDSIDEALEQLKALKVNTIIQTDLYGSKSHNQQILSTSQSRHINYSFIPGEPEFYAGKNTVDVFLGYPIISVSQTPLIGWGAILKYIFDTIVSFLLLISLSPLFLLIILLQLIFNPGPVFYTSKRLSKYSKPVSVYKFRSMGSKYGSKHAVDELKAMGREDLAKKFVENGYKLDDKDDPRITPFGRLLRKSSLDELPQLLNVLKGDLSLVGPRPIPKRELDEKFTKKHGALLLSVKSGVTGLWQVSGRSDLTNEQRIQLELYYVQNWSFWLDIKILFKTVLVVFRRTGAE
jgi:exopolysaccharide biosynthesis polyprenyl glycosylphosphotransferase